MSDSSDSVDWSKLIDAHVAWQNIASSTTWIVATAFKQVIRVKGGVLRPSKTLQCSGCQATQRFSHKNYSTPNGRHTLSSKEAPLRHK